MQLLKKSLPLLCVTPLLVAMMLAMQISASAAFLSPQDMQSIYGAGCAGEESDNTFCNANICGIPDPSNGGMRLHRKGKGITKKWCSANSPFVCDCNQTNVAQQTCEETASCTGVDGGGNCTGCGAYAVANTIQDQVNLNGATCDSDEECP